jgi:hypothetical protein
LVTLIAMPGNNGLIFSSAVDNSEIFNITTKMAVSQAPTGFTDASIAALSAWLSQVTVPAWHGATARGRSRDHDNEPLKVKHKPADGFLVQVRRYLPVLRELAHA